MNDMSAVIVAKSDQINAADLIGVHRTVTIKEVRIKAGDDQPVTVLIEGDQKVFRPCKGVRRLMVRVWGADASKYIGQSMTLFCDPSVTWAGKPEGGIRVSHMSGLDEEIIEYMRISRAATKPYKILPLAPVATTKPSDPATKWADAYIAKLDTLTTAAAVDEFAGSKAGKLEELRAARPELAARVDKALADRRSSVGGGSTFEDDFGLDPQPTTAGPEVAGAADPANTAGDGAAPAEPAVEYTDIETAKEWLGKVKGEAAIEAAYDDYAARVAPEDQAELLRHKNELLGQLV
jgi:hypothetical protein